MDQHLSTEERDFLIKLARQALHDAVHGKPLQVIDENTIPSTLLEEGTSFVTLTCKGELRGCIGSLEATLPLFEDIRQHAVAAALHDYRFPPVGVGELADIKIEISRLTKPKILEYDSAQDLLKKLNPGVDGVVIKDGTRRATFLPQVWSKISDPEKFLDQLCRKMGAPHDYWRSRELHVEIYQVEEFHE